MLNKIYTQEREGKITITAEQLSYEWLRYHVTDYVLPSETWAYFKCLTASDEIVFQLECNYLF